MAAVTIDAFVGEVPRAPADTLGAAGAQRNENLLATATDFRPLAADALVLPADGGGWPGQRSLHRFLRNDQGQPWRGGLDDGQGWLRSERAWRYARVPLNDDLSERTVRSDDEGLSPPQLLGNGYGGMAARRLGVPPPGAVQVSQPARTGFTRTTALQWVQGDLARELARLLEQDLSPVRTRFRMGAPGPETVAGATALVGVDIEPPGGPYDADRAWVRITREDAQVRGLLNQRLDYDDAWSLGGVAAVGYRAAVMPLWGDIEPGALALRLAQVQLPHGGAWLNADQATALAKALAAPFDPQEAEVMALRRKLDEQLERFVALITGANTVLPPRPQEPARPGTPRTQMVYIPIWQSPTPGVSADDYNPWHEQVRPEWVQYEQDMATWRAALAYWQQQQAAQVATGASVTELARLQSDMAATSERIEALYRQRVKDLQAQVRATLLAQNLFGAGGLFANAADDPVMELRFYVATFVTDLGEESAPGPVSAGLEVESGRGVALALAAPPPGRHVTRQRIYRSNSGSERAAFQLVAEIDAGERRYTDTVAGERLGEVCPTFGWAEPPFRQQGGQPNGAAPYLRGVVAMPNGVLAGFYDNVVAFCHPWHAYAWPVAYQITTEHEITGLGVFGRSLFVGTVANPYIITGADSASMAADKLPTVQACVSARSIAGVGDGVVYASPDGLCLASSHGVQLLTAALFAREDWQALEPAGIDAFEHEGVYYFQTAKGCFALDFAARKLTRVALAWDAVFRDPVQDAVFALDAAGVRRLFGAPQRRTGRWVSGVQVTPVHTALAWVQVQGEQSPAAPATLRWRADGKLRHEVVLTDKRPRRLPPGRWREHVLELESAARVSRVTLASSTDELQKV